MLTQKGHKGNKAIVVGLNNFGIHIACTLAAKGYEVTVADSNKENLQGIKKEMQHVLLLDKERPYELETLNFDETALMVIIIDDTSLLFSLAVILVMMRLKVKNIYVCVENKSQEILINQLGEYPIIRMDQAITDSLTGKLSENLTQNK